MEGYRSVQPVEVRFRDLDAIGHVNNVVYLTYMESARIAWWVRVTGRPDFRDMTMILARTEIDYRHPATYGDRLEVGVRCASMSRSSFVLEFRIQEQGSYPVILVPFLVLLLVFVLLLHFSSFGRGVYEIGLNAEAAHFTGVNVERTKFLLFVLAGAVAAFAGVYFTLRFGTARGDNASGLELQVIAAVLLGGVSIFGGRGALHGVVAGVLLIGVLSSAMRLEGITVNVINIVIGLLLVASVVSTSVLAWVSDLTARRNPRGESPQNASDGAGTEGRSK